MIVVREPPAPRVSGDDISPMYIGATQINNPSVIPARNLATYSSCKKNKKLFLDYDIMTKKEQKERNRI